jgi:hypothetical protein
MRPGSSVVEHLTFNQRAAGPIPARVTNLVLRPWSLLLDLTFVVCVVIAPLAAFALEAAPQSRAPDSQPLTAIELAVTQFRCHVTDTLSASTDAQRECVDAQILSIRSDFGRDLARLSAPDRRSMDAACSGLRPAEQREAYLLCVSDQLTAVHNRQVRGSVAAQDSAPLAPAIAAVPLAPATPAWRSPLVIGGTLALGAAAVGAGFFAAKSRRRRGKCRVCGVDVLDSDLCPTCRHDAAEALRHAALERAQTAQAEQEQEKKAQAEALAAAAAVPVEPAVEKVEKKEEKKVAVVTIVETKDEGVFNPYAILGVSRDAGRDVIRAAYEQTRTKYDPDLVSHLGDDAQAHFKTKAEAVERAYRMLTGP